MSETAIVSQCICEHTPRSHLTEDVLVTDGDHYVMELGPCTLPRCECDHYYPQGLGSGRKDPA